MACSSCAIACWLAVMHAALCHTADLASEDTTTYHLHACIAITCSLLNMKACTQHPCRSRRKCHIISYHSIPYYTIPYHIISYPIISYHIMALTSFLACFIAGGSGFGDHPPWSKPEEAQSYCSPCLQDTPSQTQSAAATAASCYAGHSCSYSQAYSATAEEAKKGGSQGDTSNG